MIIPRAITNLEEVCEFVLDGTHGSPKRTDAGIPVLSAQNVSNGELSYSTNRFTSSEEHAAFKRRIDLQENDLLLTIVGSIGRVARVHTVKPAVFQRSVAILRPKRDIVYSKYLYHCLSASHVQNQLKRLTNQSSQAGVYLGKLKTVEFPLPPLPEQKRIADILDKADAIRRKRAQALELTDQFLQSVFLDMFGDPVTNPKGWEFVPIGSFAKVRTGRTPSRDHTQNFVGSIPWVKTAEVVGAVIQSTAEHVSEQAVEKCAMEIFPKESLLVAMYGQGLTRGRTALLGVPATTNQACAVIMPASGYRPLYLWNLLKMSYNQLRELGRGGNQPNLNLSMIRDFSVPLPPLATQDIFIQRAAQVGLLHRKAQASQSTSSTLFDTLIQSAFRGTL